MSLFTQLQFLRDSLSNIAPSFGSPVIKSLVIVKRVISNAVPVTEYLEIIPSPYCESHRHEGDRQYNNTGISVRVDKYVLSGISRKYEKSQIIGTGLSYYLDAELNNNVLIGGINCEMESFDESNPLVWGLTLIRYPDERRGL